MAGSAAFDGVDLITAVAGSFVGLAARLRVAGVLSPRRRFARAVRVNGNSRNHFGGTSADDVVLLLAVVAGLRVDFGFGVGVGVIVDVHVTVGVGVGVGGIGVGVVVVVGGGGGSGSGGTFVGVAVVRVGRVVAFSGLLEPLGRVTARGVMEFGKKSY